MLVNGTIKIGDFKYSDQHYCYVRRNKIRTKEEFVEELRKLAETNKKFLNYSKLRKLKRNDLLYEAIKLFGGWRNACIYSGITPLTKSWSKEKVVFEIKKYAKILNKTPTREELEKLGHHDVTRAAERRFGNWNSALIACGLVLNKKPWSKELIITEMKNVVKKLGYTPSMNELRQLNKHDLLNALFRFYPSYNKFLLDLNLPVVIEMNKWTKDKVILEILNLKNKFGRTPTRSEVEKIGRLDLKMATQRYFGSWNKAIISAGLNPNLDAIKNDFGKRWELFIVKIIKKKFKDEVEYHKKLPNKTIPDIFLKKENKILEVKSNASDLSILENIKNYSFFCDSLEFWYLYGTPPKLNNAKIIFRGPDYIKNILLKLKNKELIREFFDLKNEVNKTDEEEVIEFRGM